MSTTPAGLTRVVSPDTDTALAAIVEMLEAHDVPCFVYDGRATCGVGGALHRFSKPRAILVPVERLSEAVKLIGRLHQPCVVKDHLARSSSASRLRALVRLMRAGGRLPAPRKAK